MYNAVLLNWLYGDGGDVTQLFGTDGVRARINTGAMTAENIIRLALAAGKHFLDHRDKASHSKSAGDSRDPLVVIGKDTRLSGYMVEAALQAGFSSIGMDTRLVGPLPTPGVAYLTRTLRADFGVMISASHNPHHDNGIKLFGPDGYKLPDSVEGEIAAIMAGHITLADPEKLGRARRMLDGVGRYVEYAKTVIPRSMRFDGLKVVVDCAYGAAYRAAPDLLFELGAEVIPVGVEPDGININDGCGATHPATMAKMVRDHGADVGLALDGDADRVIMADEKGDMIDGDQCLAVIADHMARDGALEKDTVVGTLMTNHGFEIWLKEKGFNLERTRVGDRYVLERMRDAGFNLGGEPSGHILMTDYGTSGDGIMTALRMLAALRTSKDPASKALRRFKPFPQRIINIACEDRKRVDTTMADAALAEAVSEAEQKLADSGRVLIRPSGTEPLIRVMVEAREKAKMESTAKTLAGIVENLVGA